jgi:hypothetical protein
MRHRGGPADERVVPGQLEQPLGDRLARPRPQGLGGGVAHARVVPDQLEQPGGRWRDCSFNRHSVTGNSATASAILAPLDLASCSHRAGTGSHKRSVPRPSASAWFSVSGAICARRSPPANATTAASSPGGRPRAPTRRMVLGVRNHGDADDGGCASRRRQGAGRTETCDHGPRGRDAYTRREQRHFDTSKAIT